MLALRISNFQGTIQADGFETFHCLFCLPLDFLLRTSSKIILISTFLVKSQTNKSPFNFNCLFSIGACLQKQVSRTNTIHPGIFLGRALWADSVSPPVRIGQNLVLDYKRRAEEPAHHFFNNFKFFQCEEVIKCPSFSRLRNYLVASKSPSKTIVWKKTNKQTNVATGFLMVFYLLMGKL